MQLLEDSLIAALAAVGLLTLLYLPLSALSRPCPGEVLKAAAVIPCRAKEGALLEHTVRTLERQLCGAAGLRRIVILDCGMDEETHRVAALLCKADPMITICNNSSQYYDLEQSYG